MMNLKKLQILGAGCPKCKQLAETAEMAAREAGMPYQLEKVTNINQIVSFGVMRTPALAVDGTVLVSGKVPSKEEIITLLRPYVSQ
ncbi:MAG: thioredoxin family protein [bacterium]